jgi:hypothetical protein
MDLSAPTNAATTVVATEMVDEAAEATTQAAAVTDHCKNQVRKTPGWPKSWANFSLLQLCSHRSAWANLHLLGQPDKFLACAGRTMRAMVS